MDLKPSSVSVAVASLAMLLPAAVLVPAAAGPSYVVTPVAAGSPASSAAGDLVARRAKIRLKAPDSVQVGDRLTVKGRVKAGSGRRVVKLVEKRDGKNRVVARTKTNRRGTFKIRVRAGSQSGSRTLRVSAVSRGRVVAKARLRFSVVDPRSATTVSATWSTASSPLDGPVTVSGVVGAVDPAGRTAVLQHQLPSGWRDVASVPVGADGSYALAAPTDWLYSTPMRVAVAASAASAEGASLPAQVSVVPTWVPPGSPGDWAELGADRPLRYDPCTVIGYRTNLAQAPAGADAAVTEALRRITQTTGLRFTPLGTTTALFDGEGPHAAYPADTGLVIGFGTAAQTRAPFDTSSTIGWGGSSGGVRARSAVLGDVWRITKGGAVLKADFSWSQPAMLEALMHEVGHAVGLGHAAIEDQVMYPVSEGANLAWGAGDLSGLSSAGLQSGCLVPAARRDAPDERPGVVALP